MYICHISSWCFAAKYHEDLWLDQSAAARDFGIIFRMERCFNIAGPCFPDEHYMLPAQDLPTDKGYAISLVAFS